MYYESWNEDWEHEMNQADAFNALRGIYDEHVQALMDHAEEACSTQWDCCYNECGNPVVRLV